MGSYIRDQMIEDLISENSAYVSDIIDTLGMGKKDLTTILSIYSKFDEKGKRIGIKNVNNKWRAELFLDEKIWNLEDFKKYIKQKDFISEEDKVLYEKFDSGYILKVDKKMESPTSLFNPVLGFGISLNEKKSSSAPPNYFDIYFYNKY